MGQYYTPIIKRKDGTFETYYTHDYDNGLKLMEHSYVGNGFVDTVAKQLYNNPGRLAWIGDYAENDDYFNGDDLAVFIKESQEEARELKHRKKPPIAIDFMEDKYVINLTKNEYVDMARYVEEAPIDRWVEAPINPLPLLTAVGNGRGGGDYGGEDSMVGYWAGDEIVISDNRPAGTDITEDCYFEEW